VPSIAFGSSARHAKVSRNCPGTLLKLCRAALHSLVGAAFAIFADTASKYIKQTKVCMDNPTLLS